MIGQSADVSNDKWFQSWITEIIVNEVIKVINDRSDSYKELESSKQQMKTSICMDDEEMDTVVLEGGIAEKKQVANLTLSENMCYPSLIDFEVHINSAPVSKSSKQGEGDYQPILRETTAFYQLRHEHNDLSNQDASTSSLITEQSDNELIESLQNNIDALSFDNVHLSESEFDSGAQSSPSHEIAHNGNELFESSLSLLSVDHSDNYDYDQDDINQSNCTNGQLRHSQKFCQVNDTQYFSSDPNLPPDYFKIVNDNYEQYMPTTDKEGEDQELLSGSSQELLIIESENINSDEDSCNTNPFHCHDKPESEVDCSLPCPVISETQKLKTPGEYLNWEEKVEVQVNVTEPTQMVQTDFGVVNTDISPEFYTEDNKNEENKNSSIIQSKTYWSNVGLITEQQVARDYLGPTPDDIGFESKGIRKVESKYLRSKRHSERELLVVGPQEREEIIIDRAPTPGKSNNDSINNLSFTNKSNQKRKKNIVFRISGLFSNMFRQKKKNKPARPQSTTIRPQDATS